ncbi:hypothetical protein BU23DRAFT_573124 [Bimuria novae-zelandiae CBS 107.79]|uniref:Uncharacterized protein n=1 Tax=Bimuria novae-zelandiae CBS 107.79 TaxID=1447943 RepID=A0A6A5UT18_9PLEO|nr:hypothetical protein BU23DRAFT_573124 [Bimuria novae-zelandiae CBS 107.79]
MPQIGPINIELPATITARRILLDLSDLSNPPLRSIKSATQSSIHASFLIRNRTAVLRFKTWYGTVYGTVGASLRTYCWTRCVYDESVTTPAEAMCEVCSEINSEETQAIEYDDDWQTLVKLGKTVGELQASDCPLCRLFALAVVNDGSFFKGKQYPGLLILSRVKFLYHRHPTKHMLVSSPLEVHPVTAQYKTEY